jgi:hypothetical protein
MSLQPRNFPSPLRAHTTAAENDGVYHPASRKSAQQVATMLSSSRESAEWMYMPSRPRCKGSSLTAAMSRLPSLKALCQYRRVSSGVARVG